MQEEESRMRANLKSPGHTYRLEGKVTTVGRGSDGHSYHIPLTDAQAEKKHAVIEKLEKDNCYVLTDLNTAHGTYVNEHRVQNTSVRLSPGDFIRFGHDKTPYELEVNTNTLDTPRNLRKTSSPMRTPSPAISLQHSASMRANSLQLSRKGSSTIEDLMSRSSSGLGTDSFNFRPDTAPTSPRDQVLRQVHLTLGERSKSVPVNMRMQGKPGAPQQTQALQDDVKSEHNDVTSPRKMSGGRIPNNSEEGQEQPWYISMLQEKERRLLQMGDEISRLSIHEVESRRKDNVIYELRKQVQESVKMLQEVQNDPTINELNQRLELMGDEIARLAVFEEECERTNKIADSLRNQLATLEIENQALRMEKATTARRVESVTPDLDSTEITDEAIQQPQRSFGYDAQLQSINESLEMATAEVDALKDRFDTLAPEKLTPEDEVIALREDLSVKNKMILELQEELNAAHKEQSISEGLVCALQNDVQQRDNKIDKLTTAVYKAETRMSEAEAQAKSMSKKFSELKEEKKHAEMTTKAEAELAQLTIEFQNTILQMDKQKEKIDKQTRDLKKMHRQHKQNVENDKVQKMEIKNLSNALDDARRQEQLSRVGYEQISARYERLRSRIVQAVFTAPGAVRPETVLSDIEVSNAVRKIIEDRSEFHKKLEELNEEVPPLLVELDSVTEDDKKDDAPQNNFAPAAEKKPGKGGRKSPKHR